MDHLPLVSVVMPAYNAADHIGTAIRSVLEQSYRNLELLVIDDCSADETPMVAAELAKEDARIRLIRLERNRGAPAGPRNLGVRAANGEWVAFLDADDLWHPEKLMMQMKALRHTGAHFCSTQMTDFVDEHDLRLEAADPCPIEQVSFWKQLINFRTPTSSVVARRELLLCHPFNEDLRFKAREDLDCWLRCMEETGASIKLRTPLMGYRIVPGQISGSKWKMFKRHLFVLACYRRKSGKSLGLGAFLFTLTHFAFALYHRRLRRRM